MSTVGKPSPPSSSSSSSGREDADKKKLPHSTSSSSLSSYSSSSSSSSSSLISFSPSDILSKAARFQLYACGPRMARLVNSSYDPRVADMKFYPDAWQRQLLDVVDAHQSALIIAPTSAGKTFISYYAIKQVHLWNQQNNKPHQKKFVVYVAPTKALVNQMRVEVYARYGDIVGIFTRDYKKRVDDATVLVTVPECLDILFLSPPRQAWLKQVAYVIFDEIHSIGNEDGAKYERLLLMCPAPFLALSATIGNPTELHSWFNRIQQSYGRQVHLITHTGRWSDLNMYMYKPNSDNNALGLVDRDWDTLDLQHLQSTPDAGPKAALHRVHPISTFDTLGSGGLQLLQRGIMPGALDLTSEDAFRLYHAMKQALAMHMQQFQKSTVTSAVTSTSTTTSSSSSSSTVPSTSSSDINTLTSSTSDLTLDSIEDDLYPTYQWRSIAEDATHPFLVDGDSLLIQAIADVICTWTPTSTSASTDAGVAGRQFLPLFYWFESTCAHLAANGRRFTITWSDDGRDMWHDTAMLLVRGMAQHHLCYACHIPTKVFPSYRSDMFASYCRDTTPAFFMLDEGSTLVSSTFHAWVPLYYRLLTLYLASSRIIQPVSLTSVEFDSGAMRSLILGAPAERVQALVTQFATSTTWKQMRSTTTTNTASEAFDADLWKRIQTAVTSSPPPSSATPMSHASSVISRWSLWLYALSKSSSTPADSFLTWLTLLHISCLNILPLASRAHVLSTEQTTWLVTAHTSLPINTFLQRCFSHLTSVITSQSQSQSQSSTSAIDLFDERLLNRILLHVATGVNYTDSDVIRMTTWAWNTLKSINGSNNAALSVSTPVAVPASLPKLPVTAVSVSAVASHPQMIAGRAPIVSLQPIACALIDAVHIDVDAKTSTSAITTTASVAVVEPTPAPVPAAAADEVPDSWDSWEDAADETPASAPTAASTSAAATAAAAIPSSTPASDVPASIDPLSGSALLLHSDSILTNRVIVDDDDLRTPQQELSKDKAVRKKQIKAQQKETAFMQRMAASLRGVKVSFRETILIKAPEEKSATDKKGGKKADKKLSNKDAILQQQYTKQFAAKAKAMEDAIKHAASYKTIADRIAVLEKKLDGFKDAQQETDIAIMGFRQLLEWHMEHVSKVRSQSSREPHVVRDAMIDAFQLIYDIQRRCSPTPGSDDFKMLTDALTKLGFVDAAKTMTSRATWSPATLPDNANGTDPFRILIDRLAALSPDTYFGGHYIDKGTARAYALKLVNECSYWLRADPSLDMGSAFRTVCHSLTPPELMTLDSNIDDAEMDAKVDLIDEQVDGDDDDEDEEETAAAAAAAAAAIDEKTAPLDGITDTLSTTTTNVDLSTLAPPLRRFLTQLWGTTIDSARLSSATSAMRLFNCLCELQSRSQLPAVVFCLNKKLCEQLAIFISSLLHHQQKENRDNPETQAAIAQAEKDVERLTERAKKERDAKDKKANKAVDQDALAAQAPGESDSDTASLLDAARIRLQRLTELSPRWSFLSPSQRADTDTVAYWKQRLFWKNKWDDTHPLMLALQVGIGIHHPALPKNYRDLVETLFRGGNLAVCIATTTLALGVNMPCKSVIFYKDSPHLTPLQFRQMSGRAGRRGYDNEGHVVFVDVPARKIAHLLTANLTSLSGHDLLSSALVLRSQLNYCNAYDKNYATQQIRTLLQQPFARYAEEKDDEKNQDDENKSLVVRQARYFYRYALEFLYRMRLIDQQGYPTGMAALVAPLHDDEPANFVLTYLLQTGAFNHIYTATNSDIPASTASTTTRPATPTASASSSGTPVIIDPDVEYRARLFLTVLCHLFDRIPLPRAYKRPRNTTSLVVLDPLPSQVQQHINTYNAQTLNIYVQAARAFAKQVSNDTEVLPISKHTYVVSSTATATSNTVEAALSASAFPYVARSPFIALSGHGDHFTSSRELVDTCRSGLTLNVHHLPVLSTQNVSKHEMRLNAYALDFYHHSSLPALTDPEQNHLSVNDVWEHLHSWDLLLTSMHQSLVKLVATEKNTSIVPSALLTIVQHLATQFHDKLVQNNAASSH